MQKKWSKEEVKKLKDMYPYVMNKNLSFIFGRSVVSIQRKAHQLNLKKNIEVIASIKSEQRIGDKCCNWKGGRKKTPKGYIQILDKNHPNSDVNGYVLEHRIIVEQKLGRYLNEDEIVHHINGVKDDNRSSNLQVMSKGEHIKLHHTGSKRSEETKNKIRQARKRRVYE